jgi:hypothetical protein
MATHHRGGKADWKSRRRSWLVLLLFDEKEKRKEKGSSNCVDVFLKGSRGWGPGGHVAETRIYVVTDVIQEQEIANGLIFNYIDRLLNEPSSLASVVTANCSRS